MTEDPLSKAIDAAAIALLSKVSGNDTLDQLMNGDVKTELLIEQVKAFEAVVKWAQAKHVIHPPPPPEKGPSKFGVMKENFNDVSAPNSRRRGAPRSPKAPAADSGPDGSQAPGGTDSTAGTALN